MCITRGHACLQKNTTRSISRWLNIPNSTDSIFLSVSAMDGSISDTETDSDSELQMGSESESESDGPVGTHPMAPAVKQEPDDDSVPKLHTVRIVEGKIMWVEYDNLLFCVAADDNSVWVPNLTLCRAFLFQGRNLTSRLSSRLSKLRGVNVTLALPTVASWKSLGAPLPGWCTRTFGTTGDEARVYPVADIIACAEKNTLLVNTKYSNPHMPAFILAFQGVIGQVKKIASGEFDPTRSNARVCTMSYDEQTKQWKPRIVQGAMGGNLPDYPWTGKQTSDMYSEHHKSSSSTSLTRKSSRSSEHHTSSSSTSLTRKSSPSSEHHTSSSLTSLQRQSSPSSEHHTSSSSTSLKRKSSPSSEHHTSSSSTSLKRKSSPGVSPQAVPVLRPKFPTTDDEALQPLFAGVRGLWESADNLSPGYRVWWTMLPALMTTPAFLACAREIPANNMKLDVLLVMVRMYAMNPAEFQAAANVS
jgi:hypothetical protein